MKKINKALAVAMIALLSASSIAMAGCSSWGTNRAFQSKFPTSTVRH
jgi:hypothetical protein